MAKRCTASPIGVHLMPSDSSNKDYRVEIFDHPTKGIVGVCECMAYVMDRNRKGGKVSAGAFGECKHISRKLADGGCGWNSETGETPTYPDVCPRCQSGLVDFTPLTGNDEVDVPDIIAKLKAMRAKAAAG